MAIHELLHRSRSWIDEAFLAYLKQSKWHADLQAYSRHVVVEGGKALRPALTFWTYQNLACETSRPPEFLVQWALALEMIHSYSLIHDDLPAMDNDDFRRGRPTLHRLKNEAAAILTGDALLTGAFEVIAEAETAAEKNLEALKLLSQSSGGAGMVSGQIRDMFESEASLEDLAKTHREKTGALFGSAVSMAGVAYHSRYQAGTSEGQALREWGTQLGLLFQMVDDVLDQTATRQALGKSVHKDENSQKRTYVSLLGLDGTRERIRMLSESLRHTGQNFFGTLALNEMLGYFTNRLA